MNAVEREARYEAAKSMLAAGADYQHVVWTTGLKIWTVKAIAREISEGPRARAKRNGTKKPGPYGSGHPRTFDHEAALALVESGVKEAEVGRRFGVSRERIRQIVKKAGMESAHSKIRAEHAAVVSALQSGKGDEEVAREFGLGLASIAIIGRRAGQSRSIRRRAKLLSEFALLTERVRNGESFNSVCSGSHKEAEKLRRLCMHLGIKSQANTRWSDFSVRREIIREELAKGTPFGAIAAKVNEAEGRDTVETAIYSWAKRHGLFKRSKRT